MSSYTSEKTKIFDIFYKPMIKTRAGGGTPKKKMGRITPTYKQMQSTELKNKNNKHLLTYYTKLKNRNPKIAPPPRPT
jgi:hypothetical protein